MFRGPDALREAIGWLLLAAALLAGCDGSSGGGGDGAGGGPGDLGLPIDGAAGLAGGSAGGGQAGDGQVGDGPAEGGRADAGPSPDSGRSGDGGGPPTCGDGVIDPGETCDPPASCPACDEGLACATATRTGRPETCDVRCESVAIEACAGGDGCCPAACDAESDPDCAVDCRAPEAWPAEWAALEIAFVEALNELRRTGICDDQQLIAAEALGARPEMQQAARCHSLDMAQGDFLGTQASDDRPPAEWAWAEGYGDPFSVLVFGFPGPESPSPQALIDGLGCRAALRDDFDAVAVAYVRDRWGADPPPAGPPPAHLWTIIFGRLE